MTTDTVADADVCRQLERERNELKKNIKGLLDLVEMYRIGVREKHNLYTAEIEARAYLSQLK